MLKLVFQKKIKAWASIQVYMVAYIVQVMYTAMELYSTILQSRNCCFMISVHSLIIFLPVFYLAGFTVRLLNE
jgi:hypothetical protein